MPPNARPMASTDELLANTPGDYEVHLTVGLTGHALGAVRAHASSNALRLLLIELPRGAHPVQPMLSWRHHGVLAEVQAQVHAQATALQAIDVPLLRHKIELAPKHPAVPQTASEHANASNHARYFEAHLKLALPPTLDVAQLTQLALAHGAHLSRNALPQPHPTAGMAPAHERRFVTLRAHSGGLQALGQRADGLRAACEALGALCLATELEWVVHDSNEALDAGWLPMPQGAPAPAGERTRTHR